MHGLAVIKILFSLLFVALRPFRSVFARYALALLVFDGGEMSIPRFSAPDPSVRRAPTLDESEALADACGCAPQTALARWRLQVHPECLVGHRRFGALAICRREAVPGRPR